MSHDISSLLFQQTWQVTVLAIAVWIAVRRFATNRPHLAHALWALVLIKCVTPPVWSSPTSAFSWLGSRPASVQSPATKLDQTTNVVAALPTDRQEIIESPANAEIAAVADIATPRSSDRRDAQLDSTGLLAVSRQVDARSAVSVQAKTNWKTILLVAWGMGAGLGLLVSTIRFACFLIWLKRSNVSSEIDINPSLDNVAKRLGVKRKVRVAVLQAAVGPAVLGFFRPTILLPEAIVKDKSPADLEPLLAHELIHVRRGDLWWAMLQTIATSLFWFHPLVWWASVAVTRESERSCDEETIACLGCRPADYARGLLEVLEQKHRLRVAPALPGVRPVDITSARLERVMGLGNGIHHRTPAWVWLVMLLCGVVVLPGAELVFAQETTSDGIPDKVHQESSPSAERQEASPQSIELKHATIDVSDLLEKIEGFKKAPGETAEQIMLAHLPTLYPYKATGLLDPSPGQTDFELRKDNPVGSYEIKDRKLLVTGPPRRIGFVRDVVESFREFGFDQIAMETRFLSLLHDDFKKLKVNWSLAESKSSHVIEPITLSAALATADKTRTSPVANAVSPVNHLRFDSQLAQGVKATSYVERNSPVLYAVINDQQKQELVGSLADWSAGNSTVAPKVTLFNGQDATISDVNRRPFVVGFDPIKDERGNPTKVTQPSIKLFEEGTVIRVKPIVRDDTMTFNCKLTMKNIVKVDSFEVFSSNGKPVGPSKIQFPTVTTTEVGIKRELSVGHTLLVAALADIKGEMVASVVMLSCKSIGPQWVSEHGASTPQPDKFAATLPSVDTVYRFSPDEPEVANTESDDEDNITIRSRNAGNIVNGKPEVHVFDIGEERIQVEGDVHFEINKGRLFFKGKDLTITCEAFEISGDMGEIEINRSDTDGELSSSKVSFSGNVQLKFEDFIEGSSDRFVMQGDDKGVSVQADGSVKVRYKNIEDSSGNLTESAVETYALSAEHLKTTLDGSAVILQGDVEFIRDPDSVSPKKLIADRMKWRFDTHEIDVTDSEGL